MRWIERFGGVLAFSVAAASGVAEKGCAQDWEARVEVTIADGKALTRIERREPDTAGNGIGSHDPRRFVGPHRSVIVYPGEEEWRRIRTLPAQHEASAEVMRKLENTVVPRLEFDGHSLVEIVEFVRDNFDLNIMIDPDLLKDDEDCAISLKVTNLTLKDALELVLSIAKLDYEIRVGVIVIKEKSTTDPPGPVSRVYLVDDRVTLGMWHAALEPSLAECVREYVEREIAPGTWAGDHRMWIRGGRLIVRHQPEVHAQIRNLVARVRSARDEERRFALPPHSKFLWCGVAAWNGSLVSGRFDHAGTAVDLELGEHVIELEADGVRSRSFVPGPLVGARFRYVYTEPAGTGAARSWRLPAGRLTSSGRGRVALAIEIEEETPVRSVRVNPAAGFEIVRDGPCRLTLSASLSEDAFAEALVLDYELIGRER